MSGAPALHEILAVISAASAGDTAARVRISAELDPDAPTTKLAVGLNLLLDDLAFRTTEQERTMDDLRRSEANFRLLFANNPLPMWVYDFQTLQFVEVNDAAVSHYGFTQDEFLQMRITDIRPDEDVPRLLEDLARTRPAMQFSGEWRHRRKNGDIIDVEIVSHRLTLNGRDVVLVVADDVTARRKSETSLQEREERLRSIYDTVADVIFHLKVEPDGGYRFVSVNPAFMAVTGLPSEMVVGKRVDEIIPPPSLTLVLDRYREAIAERKIVRWEETSDYPTGRLTGEVSVAPVFDAGGRCTHLVGAVHDITERKRTEVEREHLLAREQAARRAAQDAQRRSAFLADAGKMLSASLDYRTTLVNAARSAVPDVADWAVVDMIRPDGSLERLAVIHTDPEKIQMAYDLHRRYPPDLSGPGPMQDALRTGKPVLVPEIPAVMLEQLDDEERRLVSALGLGSYIFAPIVMKGRVTGLITMVMTESGRVYGDEELTMAEELSRRAALAIENARHYEEAQVLNLELERRVADRTAQIEEANKELEAFSYSVAHDLRAPLRAIDGFSRLVVDGYGASLPDEAQRYLSRVRQGARHMGELIDDLLTFAHVARQPLRRQRTQTAQLVQQVIAQLQPENGVATTIDMGPLPEAVADPALVRQVFANLLSNALKFSRSRAHPRIEVTHRTDGDEVTFIVRDNGVGFDMRYADKLFGVFQRLHRAEEYEGTGVGLAIVQRIIHRHGGRVWAESEIDKGATFYFTLGGAGHDE